MSITEEVGTSKCPYCGFDNPLTATRCDAGNCRKHLKAELECYRSIDVSVRTIKRIAIWWLILSILGVIASLLYLMSRP